MRYLILNPTFAVIACTAILIACVAALGASARSIFEVYVFDVEAAACIVGMVARNLLHSRVAWA